MRLEVNEHLDENLEKLSQMSQNRQKRTITFQKACIGRDQINILRCCFII